MRDKETVLSREEAQALMEVLQAQLKNKEVHQVSIRIIQDAILVDARTKLCSN